MVGGKGRAINGRNILFLFSYFFSKLETGICAAWNENCLPMVAGLMLRSNTAMAFFSPHFAFFIFIKPQMPLIAIEQSSSCRNLGVIFDSSMSMELNIKKTCRAANMQIRDIGRIRKYLSQQCTEQLVHSFITTRLDYCNCLLYGAAKHHLNHLQLIQNTAARIVTRTKRECHIRPVLKSLHWLPIDFRIIFKILLITFKAINGLAPSYISDLINPTHLEDHLDQNISTFLLNQDPH